MCTQVNKRWSCGHIGFSHVKYCEHLFKTCKGTTAVHEFEDISEKCGDCERRESLPEPREAK